MENLKAWRAEQELTQEQLAELFGVKRLTIVRYEKSIPPHMRKIVGLACRALEHDSLAD